MVPILHIFFMTQYWYLHTDIYITHILSMSMVVPILNTFLRLPIVVTILKIGYKEVRGGAYIAHV